ncbi:MAG: peptidase M13 [Sphingomonas sp. SCN 67-18]|uniref:M13 family metallopeptidase n=1 Tax=uncultured Sphingomonas sp. TaxID=158754 RepID=UPI00086DAE9C|nr:M13-type metalloendopeptidase [Sphingomonas sp. SCN 67-18]ODU20893.1 MAG: peptidase M13 [Sphingomonas sp. SCN 67-18]
MKPFSLILLASTVLAGCTTATTAPQPEAIAPPPPVEAPPPAPAPQIGTFGFDEQGMDRAANPGDDFARFVGGSWRDKTEIPADRSSFGMFHVLDDLSNERTRTIVEAAAGTPGSNIGDLYASFLDENAAEAKGVAPIRPMLDSIKALDSRRAVAAEFGKLMRIGVRAPLAARVGQDDKIPEQYIVSIYQSGLGLPDRDYYLKDDAKLAAIRTEYAAHLARLFGLAGEPNGAARAKAIVAFETGLAKVHWTRVESRDSDKTYNKWSRADFARRAPGFDWAAYLTAAGVDGQASYIVAQPSAVTGEAKLIGATPLPVLRDYLMVRTLDGYAPYLSKAFVDENFAFNGTTLSGTPQNRPRWKRGVALVTASLGEAVGEKYVAQYFPPESKAAADALVKNVIAAMDNRLANLAWMAPETKAKARAKLAAFTPKIGYPDKWRDYSALQVKRDDLVGNVQRAREFDYQYDLDKLGKPIDRGEWFMTPMTVNAYANPTMNEIVFPAAILQPPFFDAHADAAVNYGGIGAVIGHEISHHFDDQGRKYDIDGKLTDWWTADDVKRFDALTDKLVKQYDAYEPLPGLHVQGALTLGENIADLAGMTVAYDAYKLSLGGKDAPVIDGFTGDQRFYLGWGQVWRSKYREAQLRQQLLTDPHSPGEQRTSVVRNLDPWYAAFSPAPTSKLYLAPDDRVRIW